jgi:hypothetical protein
VLALSGNMLNFCGCCVSQIKEFLGEELDPFIAKLSHLEGINSNELNSELDV